MSDRVTYRDMGIMEEVLNQRQKQVCWAISLTRQLAALLKLRGQLNINASLSIQYLINKVGSSLFGAQMLRPWNGSVRSLQTAIPFLVNGTVLENLVPLRQFDLQSSTPENHVLGERRYRATPRRTKAATNTTSLLRNKRGFAYLIKSREEPSLITTYWQWKERPSFGFAYITESHIIFPS
ncbi:hypothetical protein YC2023_080585 [Brassica napus]